MSLSSFESQAVRAHPTIPFYERKVLPGSIRTHADLKQIAVTLLDEAPSQDAAIAVLRGAIDREVFPFEELNVTDPFEGSAKFHQHLTYDLALVPQDGNVFVPTLLSTQAAVVEGLRELFGNPPSDLAGNKSVRVMFNVLSEMVRSTKDPDEMLAEYERIIRRAIGSPLYPLLQHIQSRVRDILPIQWANYDICALGKKCVHARDIRVSRERDSFGQLRYILPRRHEQKRESVLPLQQ
jgi:hypothetical protein